MPHERLILGAMSGTSADGVDVALTHITGRGLEMRAKLLTHAYHPYATDLRRQILDTRQRGDVRLSDLAEMGRRVTLAYVEACKLALKQASVSADQVAAVAAHGQTLFHGPPNTIQYFDPSLLAFETGIAVVSDFRRADLAAGGQGAPLVPFADWILFRHPTKSRVLLNIGGIANITYLKAGGSINEVIAFDTGPGNCVSDWLLSQKGSRGIAFDEGGQMALRGTPSEKICWQFVDHPFVDAAPPKSTDGPAMISAYEDALSDDASESDRAIEDQLRTACAVMAWCVGTNLAYSMPESPVVPDEIVVAGGGAENAAMMLELQRQFSTEAWRPDSEMFNLLRRREGGRVDIRRLEDLGINVSAREALAFALLGAATLDGEPSNVPSATGATRRVVLGSITPRPWQGDGRCHPEGA